MHQRHSTAVYVWLVCALAHASCLDFAATPSIKIQTSTPSAPHVAAVAPPQGAVAVSLTSALQLSFDRAMDPATVTVTLAPALALGAASWDPSFLVVTFASLTLAASTSYEVNVAGKSADGVALAGTVKFSFMTAAAAAGGDTTPPTLNAWGLSAFATSDNPAVVVIAPSPNPWPNDGAAGHDGVRGATAAATLDLRFSEPVLVHPQDITLVERTYDGTVNPPSVPRVPSVSADADLKTFHVTVVGATVDNPYAIYWTIAPTLTDLAGNPVASTKPLHGQWRVAGNATSALVSIAALDGWSRNDGSTYDSSYFEMQVGYDKTSDKFDSGYLSFDVSSARAQYTHVVSAVLSVTLHGDVGDPFASIGPLQISPVSYTDIANAYQLQLDGDCPGFCGVDLATSTAGTPDAPHTAVITSFVAYQLAHGRDTSQFLLDHLGFVKPAATCKSFWITSDGMSPSTPPPNPPLLTLTYEWLGPDTWP